MKRMKRKNEDMMFISIDGFEEIESLFPEKAPKHASASWKKPSKRVRMKTAKAIRDSRMRSRRAKPRKKRTAIAVAACITAIMLSCATVAGALEGNASGVKVVRTTAEAPACHDCHNDCCRPVDIDTPDYDDYDYNDYDGDEGNNGYDDFNGYDYDDYDDGDDGDTYDAPAYDAPYYALYIDGTLMGVVEDGDALQAALDQILLDAKAVYDGETFASFENDVAVRPFYDEVSYTDEVDELINEMQGLYAIRLETTWTSSIEVPYDTEITYDDSLPEGYEEITQMGQNAVWRVVSRLSFVDGELIEEVVTCEEVTEESVTEKKIVGTEATAYTDTDDTGTGDTQTNDTQTGDTETGDTQTGDTETGDTQTGDTETGDTQTGDTETGDTETGDTETGDTQTETVVEENVTTETEAPEAETPQVTTTSGDGTSTGGFIWPLPHTHNLTSLMGERWGRMHNGIDIAGGDDYGQPIIAADSGTVIWSGNDGGGYGNYVMIDHGNGYVTVYGHASSLACSTGDYVNQGDTIAYVGSTGNSTGPHLHFEIRLNGEYQDPLNYVS